MFHHQSHSATLSTINPVVNHQIKATYLHNVGYLLRETLNLPVESDGDNKLDKRLSCSVLLVPLSLRRSELWRLVGQDYWDIKID